MHFAVSQSHGHLTSRTAGLTIPANSRAGVQAFVTDAMVRIMKAIQNLPIANTPEEPMEQSCKHTRVRVVAREDDVEFVECQECGDVFEASEFKDMAIEENIRPEDT
jgi:Zn ribbon nucleic-acid-binding protein